MTNILVLSSRIYGCLLLLYPKDLREDFGADMSLVFAEDLAAAWHQTGFTGVIRVWSGTLGETVRIGLPGQRDNPVVTIPTLLFTLSFVLGILQLRSERMFTSEQAPTAAAFVPFLSDILKNTVLWPGAAAVASFAAVRRYESNAVISLGLGTNTPHER
jgi:hypothetical protein